MKQYGAILLTVAVMTAVSGTPWASDGGSVRVDYRDPPRSYIESPFERRVIRVERQLHEEDPELEKKALARLESSLALIMRSLPESARPSLAQVPIYLMYGVKAKAGGRPSGAQYFRPNEIARGPWLDEHWGGSLVVYSAKNYAQLSDVWAAKLIAHELAHAYHFSHFPERQPDIVAAHRNAVSRKLYRQVPTRSGKIVEKGYALSRPPEYFAELSAMYFVGGNYFPYDREGLKSYDPAGYAVVEKLWGIR